MEMLKKEYHNLRKPEDVDKDPRLSDKQKGMLKSFLMHIDYVTNRPSENDKKALVNVYYEGMFLLSGKCLPQ